MKKEISIWIIDDDKLYSLLTYKTLLKLNPQLKISSYYNGEDALLALKTTTDLPNIIFIDINMPIMDGWEFLQEYAKLKTHLDKDIWLYAVSSSISNSDFLKASKHNELKEYITKPIKNEKILEILNKII